MIGPDSASPDLPGLLGLSAERDQWHDFAYRLARDSYLSGYADGRRAERRAVDREFAARPPARPPANAPTFAELEERRGATARTAVPRVSVRRLSYPRSGTGR